jgi:hypothetical protein
MRNRSIVILGLAGILTMSACSSSSEEKPKTQTTSAANSANSNTVAISNGAEVAPPRPADANGVATASSDQITQPGNSMQTRLEKMRTAGEAGPPIDAAALALKNARPAPDNSTFTSYLTDAGYEIRTFKNHPQLLKVEKKISSDGKQSLKVFLRGGRVIELPGQKINPLSTAPAAHILNMAGVQPQPQQAPAGPPATKKSGQ